MRRKLAALVTTGVLALTGCASGNPQVAAYVNGEAISQAKVDAAAKALASASGDSTGTAGSFSSTVVSIMIASKVAEHVAAADPSLAVTAAEREQKITSDETLAALVKDPGATDFINSYVDATIIVSTEAGQQAFVQQIGETTVELNPRLGTWDPQKFSVVEGSSGSLSAAAPVNQG